MAKSLWDWCLLAHQKAIEKGFWDYPRPVPQLLMLVVTELSEACEADRRGDYEQFQEEIADTFIRLFDLCAYLTIDIEEEIKKKMKKNKSRPYRHGKRY